jgi:hypothetical protein
MEFNQENIRQEQLKDAKLYSTRYEYAIDNIAQGSSILEVGTLAGDYAEYLIKTCNPSRIDLLDKFDQSDWEVPGYIKRFNSEDHREFVMNRFKNDKRVNVINGALRDVLPLISSRYDYVYLDADHRELGVGFQIQQACRLVSPGGVIGINDYTRFGIIREEDYGKTPYSEANLGVVPAVNRFLLRNKEWHVKAFALNDRMFSDIYLHKPEKY